MPKFTRNSKEVLRDGKHFGDCLNDEDAQMVCDALNRLRKTMLKGWQPIETAPKDGTIIIIASTPNYVEAAYWSQCSQAAGGDDEFPWVILDEINGVNGRTADSPTHWMSLPEFPE